ncbi:MAG TPA: hypothetical protein V6C88_20635, partial [Chroococcidiopsis sp.]
PDPSLVELIEFSSRALLRKPVRRSPDAVRQALRQRAEPGAASLPSTNSLANPLANPLAQRLPDYAIATPEAMPSELTELDFEGAMVIEWVYAPPIMPLRDRDLSALAEFFAAADMERIEADVLKGLRDRYPEPCWDEDLFEFLADFLHP